MNRNLLPRILVFFLCFICCHTGSAQIITTIAGSGGTTYGGDGGPATAAGLEGPVSSCFDKYGNFYIVDRPANRVRKVDNAGVITTVAGNGFPGFAGDGGPATDARLNYPCSVKTDTFGNLYIAEMLNGRVRKVDMATGIITTFAGSSTPLYGVDGGPATATFLDMPISLAIDKFNNVYIATRDDNKVHKVDASGIITLIAGMGAWYFSGDGGPAIYASLFNPSGLAVDDSGNLYIAEATSYCNRVRKVNMAGIINTVAGNGTAYYTGDGMAATNAAIAPGDVAFDAMNNMFITDDYNGRIYKVDAGTHILHTVAGTGAVGYTGDGGPATAATLSSPTGISIDKCGNTYVCDLWENRVRKIAFNSTHPSIWLGITPSPGDSVCTDVAATFNATYSADALPVSYSWYVNGTFATSGTSGTYAYAPADGDSVTCVFSYIEHCSGDTVTATTGRKVHVLPATYPSISLTATTPASVGSIVTVNAALVNVGTSYDIKWMKNGVLFATTATSTVMYTKTAGMDTITAKVTSHSAIGCYDSAASSPATIEEGPAAWVHNAGAAEWKVYVYPNPAKNHLGISGLPVAGNITISNMTGQVVWRQKINGVAEIVDVSSLVKGIYAVTIVDDEGKRVVVKVVKE